MKLTCGPACHRVAVASSHSLTLCINLGSTFAFRSALKTMQAKVPPPASGGRYRSLLELVKHVFIGVALFLLLAIPAICLDFANQGVQLLQFRINGDPVQASEGAVVSMQARPGAVTVRVQANVVAVSTPVRRVLTGFEWLLLAIDTAGVGGYLLSSLVKYLRSLEWS